MPDLAYAQTSPGGGPGPLVQLFPLLLVFVVFYFLLIRPQQQKLRAHRQMLEGLKRNDEVVTSGGMYGRVVELGEKAITLEVAPNVRLRISRQHIESRADTETSVKAGKTDKSEGKEK